MAWGIDGFVFEKYAGLARHDSKTPDNINNLRRINYGMIALKKTGAGYRLTIGASIQRQYFVSKVNWQQ